MLPLPSNSAFAFRPTVDEANIDQHASIADIVGGLNTVNDRLNSISHSDSKFSSANPYAKGLKDKDKDVNPRPRAVGVVELARTGLGLDTSLVGESPLKGARQATSARTANAHRYNENPSTEEREIKKRLRFKLDKGKKAKEDDDVIEFEGK